MQLAEAEKNFAMLVELVHSRGVSVDLERDHQVIARLMPALPGSPLQIGRLNDFLRRLPALGEDADDFSAEIRAIRAELPPESVPWD